MTGIAIAILGLDIAVGARTVRRIVDGAVRRCVVGSWRLAHGSSRRRASDASAGFGPPPGATPRRPATTSRPSGAACLTEPARTGGPPRCGGDESGRDGGSLSVPLARIVRVRHTAARRDASLLVAVVHDCCCCWWRYCWCCGWCHGCSTDRGRSLLKQTATATRRCCFAQLPRRPPASVRRPLPLPYHACVRGALLPTPRSGAGAPYTVGRCRAARRHAQGPGHVPSTIRVAGPHLPVPAA